MEDILETAEDSAATIEADPEKLTLNEKLQALYKLQHKHTVGSVDELKVIETD
nr:hypothetical protein [Ulvibacter sp. MAR_2010_11]